MAIDVRLIDVLPGGNIAAIVTTTQEDIAVIDRVSGRLRLLTNDAPKDRGPNWIDDGRSIMFYSDRSGAYQVWQINADGSGLRRVSDFPHVEGTLLYFPSRPRGAGVTLYFFGPNGLYSSEPDDDGLYRQMTLVIDSSEGWTPLMRNWSPDGTRLIGPIASSSQAGDTRVSVFSRIDNTWEIVFEGSGDAAWLSENTIVVGQGSKLLRVDLQTGEESQLYVTPEGAGLLMIDADPTTNEIFFVQAEGTGDIWMVDLDESQ